MNSRRKIAAIVGGLYLLTFVTSIPALALKRSFLDGAGVGAELYWAVLLELVLAAACLGTAVAFYAVGRRHNPVLALGFVVSRTVEAVAVLLGVIALLSLGTLRGTHHLEGAKAVDVALVALHDWAFLVGPGLLPAVNALLFGTLLLRLRLVPRIIPIVGLIGAPLLLCSAVGTLFGVNDQVSPLAGLAALPIALWEFSVGAWLLLRGFAETKEAPELS